MRIDFRTLAIFAALILMSVPLGFHISRASPLGSLGIVAGVVIFTVSFLNVEFAIYMVILSMLLSPEIYEREKKYWDVKQIRRYTYKLQINV